MSNASLIRGLILEAHKYGKTEEVVVNREDHDALEAALAADGNLTYECHTNDNEYYRLVVTRND